MFVGVERFMCLNPNSHLYLDYEIFLLKEQAGHIK